MKKSKFSVYKAAEIANNESVYLKYGLTKELAYTVFSYLTGAELFHKIALVNKEIREELPKAEQLDQEKELSLRVHSKRVGLRLPKVDDFNYGFKLANVINFDSLLNCCNIEPVLDPLKVLQALASKNNEIDEKIRQISFKFGKTP